jgi:tetraacyldisaccharide 4'-kinase
MLDEVWYHKRHHPLSYLLLPLTWLYCAVVRMRQIAYRRGWLVSRRLPIPVIVVGNLTVGGTGKTPLVLWLTHLMRQEGFRPGIVSRGYGGSGRAGAPRLVTPESDPFEVGDEAVLLAQRTPCPVAVCPDRVAAARMIAGHDGCDMIVADDGLQHYRLGRDIEILLVDGERGFGNGRCLPAGPLREPLARVQTVDRTICNGVRRLPGAASMRLMPGRLVNLGNADIDCELQAFRGRRVTAVAGIGNPARFFDLLRSYGMLVQEWRYPDHHRFSADDVASWPDGPVLMTEKDAVKCKGFAAATHWYLPVEAELDQDFAAWLTNRLRDLKHGQEAARHPGMPLM